MAVVTKTFSTTLQIDTAPNSSNAVIISFVPDPPNPDRIKMQVKAGSETGSFFLDQILTAAQVTTFRNFLTNVFSNLATNKGYS